MAGSFSRSDCRRAQQVWSAFVAGQPVQPSLRDGKMLLPIQQSGVDDGAMSVELTYVGTNTFPRTRGTVGFVSPKFDVPLKNARWEIYLPPDYDYQDFGGTMTRETAAAPAASSAELFHPRLFAHGTGQQGTGEGRSLAGRERSATPTGQRQRARGQCEFLAGQGKVSQGSGRSPGRQTTRKGFAERPGQQPHQRAKRIIRHATG